ncbi:MAG TPA: hypothetical protein VKV77_11190 [Methylovirgula sp.]|nr:hypothetical protein [Methylovirgula sp.]
MPWSLNITEPISLKNKSVLRSLKDAADLLLGLGEACQRSPWYQHAARLLMEAAASGKPGDIEEATVQMRRALTREGMM